MLRQGQNKKPQQVLDRCLNVLNLLCRSKNFKDKFISRSNFTNVSVWFKGTISNNNAVHEAGKFK